MADEPKKEETTPVVEETKKEVAPAKEEPKKEELKKEAPKAEEKPAKEKKAPADLSKDAEKIMDLVKKLPVMDLASLVKALEEEFGVTAAAPMMMAGGGGAAGGEAGEEEGRGKKSVVLVSAGGQKIAVIKAVREITGLGLKEAKDLVDAAPKAVKEDLEPAEAEDLKKKLEETGATVELQ